jgi:hypothetical protein
MHNNSIHASNATATSNLWLFGRSDTKQLGTSRIRSFKVEGKFNLIPCYRNSDNEIGMYDLINDAFYINDGAGDFVAGNEITIPNPDHPQDIHVVTGNNTIEVQGKNLFPSDLVRTDKDWLKVNDDGSVTINYPSGNTLTQVNLFRTPINIPESTYRMKIFVEGTFKGGNLILQNINGNWGNQRSITDGQLFSFSSLKNMQIWEIYAGTNCTIKFELEEGTTVPTEYHQYYHKDYPINLGSLELCKIGNYQDYLYKENGNWYKKPNILKTNFNATTRISSIQKKANDQAFDFVFFDYCDLNQNNILAICTHYPSKISFKSKSIFNDHNTDTYIVHPFDDIFTSEMTVAQARAKFHEVYDDKLIFYTKMTQEPIEITDETLIAQLDAIENAMSTTGTTTITQTNADLPFIINATALLKND